MKDVAHFLVNDRLLFDPATQARRRVPKDVYRWALEQADHMRMGRFELLDRDALADEIEDLARSEFKSIASHLEIILTYMIKWDHQPKKRSRSWILSIDEHRLRVADDLTDSPSLKARSEEAVERAYRYARVRASKETRLTIEGFPESCPYSWIDIMERPFVVDAE